MRENWRYSCKNEQIRSSENYEQALNLAREIGDKNAIASLGKIDDFTTQELMTQFYTFLKQGNMSKAEALRQV
ncbi:CHAT domain-containing protein [Oscillatoria salina]|uniref:CHAT domain-containing protein n=1 Tax=Oscillatoria salina TaxID=331517 RepID=UPI0013B846F1|nr:CHAT domain-containing protein [Oscillatoria salina]MBZ8182644.1 CHAT domain-containing protein [Oscillatoria salina IIICB1]NET88362.1 CHAT domain-containing protein [Kamptonema sp. SIO1D9]